MGRLKIAVLFPCDEAQKRILAEAGKGQCEFWYIDRQMPREERLPVLRQAEVIFGEPGIREIQNCPRLKWVQMSWAGTDVYTMREGFPEKVKLTNARGCFQTVIAEYIMAEAVCQAAAGRVLEADRKRDIDQREECVDFGCRRYWYRCSQKAESVRSARNWHEADRPELSGLL